MFECMYDSTCVYRLPLACMYANICTHTRTCMYVCMHKFPKCMYASLVWRCLVGCAPVYVRELCCPPLSAMSSRSLRSSQQGLLLVPFARTFTKQIRAFSVVGPSTWNVLPSELRIFNRTTSPAFFSHNKTALFDRAGV